MLNKKQIFWIITSIVVLAVLALAARFFVNGDEEKTFGSPSPSQANVGLANPASVNCVDKGGQTEIRTDESGGQYGVCKFNDGSECEEWKFFREECKIGDNKK